jgi:CARDB
VLVLAVVMLATPVAAAAKKRHVPRPDLKVTSLVANFGDPAYAVVGTDGVMESIQVRVGIRNQGQHTIAPPSTLDVYFQDSARKHFEVKIHVPRLKFSIHPRHYIVDIDGARPKLGYAQLGAFADVNRRVKESDEDNNFFKGEHFVVIARQWDVPYFDTIVTIPGEGTRTTSSGSSFHFEFSYYDHSKAVYIYLPVGSISSTMVYAGGLCSGTGSSLDSKSPWGGFLHIAGDFRYYDALVQTSSITYTVPVDCIVFSRSVSETFDDLDTTATGSFPLTNEQATKVTGADSDPIKRTQWKWQFHAAGF